MRILAIFLFTLFYYTASAQVREIEKGVASYYGKKFHGRKTASGELFNMDGMTAAHPRLPFNTLVKVTNLANNRSVVVRINDRGPFVKDRVIDVSKAAAEKLGFVRDGKTRVRIEVIGE